MIIASIIPFGATSKIWDRKLSTWYIISTQISLKGDLYNQRIKVESKIYSYNVRQLDHSYISLKTYRNTCKTNNTITLYLLSEWSPNYGWFINNLMKKNMWEFTLYLGLWNGPTLLAYRGTWSPFSYLWCETSDLTWLNTVIRVRVINTSRKFAIPLFLYYKR